MAGGSGASDGFQYAGATFNPLIWKQFLTRHHTFATLCWRCAHVLGLVRTPTASEVSSDEDESQKKDVAGSNVFGGGLGAEISSDEDEGENEVYPEWLEVHITHSSRAMMLQWARMAKNNLKRKAEESRGEMLMLGNI